MSETPKGISDSVVKDPVRVRMAPSPTGYLHIGGCTDSAIQLSVRQAPQRQIHPPH